MIIRNQNAKMELLNHRDSSIHRLMLTEEEDLVDSSKYEPLIITTIPIAFTSSGGHGKRGVFPLIKGTLSPEKEEAYINELLDTLDKGVLGELLVVVYGQNAMDKSATEKARQLNALGFSSVCVYLGGMFEWCLLQDVYGKTEFPVTFGGEEGGSIIEPLLFKGKRLLAEENII